MPTHTDSEITEYHDDGSYTTTSVYTVTPASKAQKVLAGVGVAVLMIAPAAPLLYIAAIEKYEEKRDARRERKAQQSS